MSAICCACFGSAKAGTLADCMGADGANDPTHTVELCRQALSQPDIAIADRTEALVSLGAALRSLGQLPESQSTLEEAVRLSPANAGALRMLAWTYREGDQPQKAEAALTRSLDLEDSVQGLLSRCVVRQDQQRFEESLGDCTVALTRDPENTDAIFFTARAHNALQEFAQALSVAKTGLNLRDNDGRIFGEAAYAAWQIGAKDEATAIILHGLKLYPADEAIQTTQDWIAAQRN